jgi:hypothetical protein
MGEVAQPGVGDLPSFGDLLALLHSGERGKLLSFRQWDVLHVPERLPADWSSSYTFIEPSRRPPSAACVSINYRSDDGHESVSPSQYAVGSQPDQYNLMLKRDDWQTITRNGHRRQGPCRQPDSGAHRTRPDVRVPHLGDLTAEQLGTVAAGLKPASTTSSV